MSTPESGEKPPAKRPESDQIPSTEQPEAKLGDPQPREEWDRKSVASGESLKVDWTDDCPYEDDKYFGTMTPSDDDDDAGFF